MICYKDKTFCEFYKECKLGNGCDRALTDKLKKEAEEWWGSGEFPISYFIEKPDCFEERR